MQNSEQESNFCGTPLPGQFLFIMCPLRSSKGWLAICSRACRFGVVGGERQTVVLFACEGWSGNTAAIHARQLRVADASTQSPALPRQVLYGTLNHANTCACLQLSATLNPSCLLIHSSMLALLRCLQRVTRACSCLTDWPGIQIHRGT